MIIYLAHIMCERKTLEHVHMLSTYRVPNMLGLVRELDPHVKPNHYCVVGGLGKLSQTGITWVYCGPTFKSITRESTINTSSMFGENFGHNWSRF